jgi:hypothetical protein
MSSPPFTALVLSALAMPAAHAGGPSDVGGWIRSAGVRPEAHTRVLAWVDDDLRVTEAFAASYPGWVQARIAAAVERHLPGAATSCEPSVQVRFVEPGSVGETDADRAFEQSTFQVESLHCLEHGDAAGAMAVYNSVDFRETVMPGLERYWLQGDGSCLTTSAVFGVVGRTEACLTAREFVGEGVRAFHTRLIESVDSPEHQGIFLRESVVAFVDRAEGGVAVYRIVTTRSKDMGAVQRTILSHAAGSAQEKVAEALEERLR